jgi:hypothetical protein
MSSLALVKRRDMLFGSHLLRELGVRQDIWVRGPKFVASPLLQLNNHCAGALSHPIYFDDRVDVFEDRDALFVGCRNDDSKTKLLVEAHHRTRTRPSPA